MNTYHITWFENIDDYRSKGENYDAVNPRAAIYLFEENHPGCVFLSCVSMEVLNRRGISEQS
jgi:hypothetical protein